MGAGLTFCVVLSDNRMVCCGLVTDSLITAYVFSAHMHEVAVSRALRSLLVWILSEDIGRAGLLGATFFAGDFRTAQTPKRRSEEGSSNFASAASRPATDTLHRLSVWLRYLVAHRPVEPPQKARGPSEHSLFKMFFE